MPRTLSLFFSYSSRDDSLRKELEAHLSVLRREELIAPWSFRKIVPGEEWAGEIDAKLKSADIILLLISADFLNSDYCWSVELKAALRRHERGETKVIPVILRDCDWKTQSFSRLQALPNGGKPVTRFRPRDVGWTEVVLGIRSAADSFAPAALPSVQPPVVPKAILKETVPNDPAKSKTSSVTANAMEWQLLVRTNPPKPVKPAVTPPLTAPLAGPASSPTTTPFEAAVTQSAPERSKEDDGCTTDENGDCDNQKHWGSNE